MKKKSLTFLLSGLLTVSLTGVGFASWYVIQGDDATATGNIVTETISDDKSIVISNPTLTPANFNFGADEGQKDSTGTKTAAHNWLRNNGVDGEKLSTTISFTVENYDEATNFTIDFTVTDNNSHGYENAISNEGEFDTDKKILIVPPDNRKITKADLASESAAQAVNATISLSDDKKVATITVTYTYAWGSAFGGHNPLYYYNNQEYSTTLAEDARVTLGNLNSQLGGVQYNITIKASA